MKIKQALSEKLLFAGLPEPQREYRFMTNRRFRWDYAWPEQKVALEIDGATFAQGGHTRGAAYDHDREKDAYGQLHGWRLLRVSTKQLDRRFGWCRDMLTELLDAQRISA